MNRTTNNWERGVLCTACLSLTLAAFAFMEVKYAKIPKGFRKLICDHPQPCPWETWMSNGNDGAEIWRGTFHKSEAKLRLGQIMDRLQLSAIHFEKIRTRSGKSGFGGVLENYKAGYTDDPRGPKNSIALWRASKGDWQRVIVTQYPIDQTKKFAQMMTNQIAGESRLFLARR